MTEIILPGFGYKINVSLSLPAVTLGPIQQRWLDVLKSGTYVQGKRMLGFHLDGGDRYCCLGVACTVLGLPGMRGGTKHISFDSQFRVLSTMAYERLGLFSREGLCSHMFVPAGPGYDVGEIRGLKLTTVNDESTAGFEPIIALIEGWSGHIFKESK